MIVGPPNLTHSFLTWITEQDTKDEVILEFGAGGSTIFFSKIFKRVRSFENNEKWKLQIEKLVPVNVRIFDFDLNWFPEILKNVSYILIDNDVDYTLKREDLAKMMIEKYGYKDKIILDNGNWHPICYFYLKKMYKKCQDFGWYNTYGEETITSVFSELIMKETK